MFELVARFPPPSSIGVVMRACLTLRPGGDPAATMPPPGAVSIGEPAELHLVAAR